MSKLSLSFQAHGSLSPLLSPTSTSPSPSPIDVQPPPLHRAARPARPDQQRRDHRHASQHGLKHERALHIPRRAPATTTAVGIIIILERRLGDDEDGPQELPPGPAQRTADLGGERIGDLDEVLERDGDEAEGGGAAQGTDDVGEGEGAGRGGEDEEEVGDEE